MHTHGAHAYMQAKHPQHTIKINILLNFSFLPSYPRSLCIRFPATAHDRIHVLLGTGRV